MKRVHESGERNKAPIGDVLDPLLPPQGLILEVASGTGQHVAYFARRFPHLMWQPSDPDPEARRSIMAHLEHSGLSNVRAPLDLDAARGPWPIARVDAIVCINMVHISPWSATLGLLSKAKSLLEEGHRLFLYGPYRIQGRFNAPSNEEFDASLRARNPEWGVRDLADVERAASPEFALIHRFDMPANNYTVVFERCGSSGQSGSTPEK